MGWVPLLTYLCACRWCNSDVLTTTLTHSTSSIRTVLSRRSQSHWPMSHNDWSDLDRTTNSAWPWTAGHLTLAGRLSWTTLQIPLVAVQRWNAGLDGAWFCGNSSEKREYSYIRLFAFWCGLHLVIIVLSSTQFSGQNLGVTFWHLLRLDAGEQMADKISLLSSSNIFISPTKACMQRTQFTWTKNG